MMFTFYLCSALLLAASLTTAFPAAEQNLYALEIIHINDFHDRFEETNENGDPCKPNEVCIGGYARTVAAIKQLQEQHKDKNQLYLNGADNFQGTLWYTLLGSKVTSEMLNLLPADAMTLGNHEFDNGVDGLIPFLQSIKSPVLVANIDDRNEPRLKGLYQKSMIIRKGNRKIGIIGVIARRTQELSDTGKVKFTDEIKAVKDEAAILRQQGVGIIIVVSHAGLDVERQIAKEGGPCIDVIVGAHTHSFLYSGDNPPGPDQPEDTYPIVVEQDPIVEQTQTGLQWRTRKVYIVQAGSYSRYVGSLQLYFDLQGEVVKAEGNPIYLSNDIVPDQAILEALIPWKKQLTDIGQAVMGESLVTFDRYLCNDQECTIGNLIADSFSDTFIDKRGKNEWALTAIGLQNVGNIRANLFPGELKYEDLVAVLPFRNRLTAFDIRGDRLLAAIEYGLSEDASYRRNLLHTSGLKITVNLKNSSGNRVVKMEIMCQTCSSPTFEPFDPFKTYRVVTLSFIAEGGDGFTMFKDFGSNRMDLGLDIDAFTVYIQKKSPLDVKQDGRLTFA